MSVDGDWLYLCYAKAVGGNVATAIDKARLVGTSLQGRMTLTSNHQSPSAHHFGCRPVLQDNHLFASLGDRGEKHWRKIRAFIQGASFASARWSTSGKCAVKRRLGARGFLHWPSQPQGLAQHYKAAPAHEHGPKEAMRLTLSQLVKIMAGRLSAMAKIWHQHTC